MKIPDIKIIFISTILVLSGFIAYSEFNPNCTDQVYRVQGITEDGKYYQVSGSLYLYNNGSLIEYTENFSMPLGARAIGVHFKIPADGYKPIPGDYIHVKRKRVLNRVTVLDVGKINYTNSVFNLATLD